MTGAMTLPQTIVLQGDSLQQMHRLQTRSECFALTFLDPPFNQGKSYAYFNDNLPEEVHWGWMKEICEAIHTLTLDGGAIYFMQREKNLEHVLRALRETGWTVQNVIVWAKRTAAVPIVWRFGKQYQIIAFATKGSKLRVFHHLRIDAPLHPDYQYPRPEGIYVTDIGDDVRELTSGYFAGKEVLRNPNGDRIHKQQAPVALLARILLDKIWREVPPNK